MDLFAHAAYGAVLCSRSGLAGGRKGLPGRRWYRDGTLWLAVFFGLLPDIVSMWVPYVMTAGWADAGRFFGSYGGGWLEVYRWVHSLIPALLFCGLMGVFSRKLFIVSLAWPVHILCDAVSHGTGKFGTMIFYPLSRFQFDGIPFWRHGWFMVAYWVVLAALAVFIILWRGRTRRRDNLSTTKTRKPDEAGGLRVTTLVIGTTADWMDRRTGAIACPERKERQVPAKK